MTAVHRVATADEVSEMTAWAAAEGWNPGLEDATAMRAADPEGFWVAELDGEAVASISVVNHSDDFAFLGLYICKPAYRGQGLAFDLWNAALTHAAERTVGLDGVPDQQDNYSLSSFARVGETRRFVGRPPAGPQEGISLAEDAEVAELTAFEAAANGYAKEAFMAGWCQQTRSRRTFRVAGVDAFYTVRRCQEGCKIGPLVAEDIDTAAQMIGHCAARHPNDDLIIDVPDDSTALTALCETYGMTVPFHTARMYRGTPPTPGPQIRSIATLELG